MTRKPLSDRLPDLVTVTVAPRERHSSLLSSLVSLFATIPPGVRVIVAQGDMPEGLRHSIAELQRLRPFELIAPDFPLYPQEARNLCLDKAETDYVVFADNDIEYEQGWLEAIVGNAIEHRADIVAPVIFIGPPRARTIHHAGGRIRLHRLSSGALQALEEHQFSNVDIDEADLASLGVSNHTVEFHCFLARRDYLVRSGGLDERMTTQEQVHFGLLAHNLGAKVTFAADCRVTYIAKKVFEPADLDYLSFRWNDRQALDSMRAIKALWGIEMDEQVLLLRWIRRHRLRAYGTFYPEQSKRLPANDFYQLVMKPVETAALRRAGELRAGKKLKFCDPVDRDRLDATLEAFVVDGPSPGRVPASSGEIGGLVPAV